MELITQKDLWADVRVAKQRLTITKLQRVGNALTSTNVISTYVKCASDGASIVRKPELLLGMLGN